MFSIRKRRFATAALVLAAGWAFAVASTPRARWFVGRGREMAAHRLGMRHADLDAARERLRAKLPGGELPDPADVRIVVHKSRRAAEVLVGDVAVLEYAVVLGGDPVGHKQREGDGRTPEGTYRICTRLDRSSYLLFMGLSYPNAADAEAGVRVGAIDAATRDAIAVADGSATQPPWNTPLGGAVGMHGGGTAFDWTRGCVAFDDAAVEEVWVLTGMGTVVEIRR